MGGEFCSSPNLFVFLWDLARLLKMLQSLAGALWKYTWPDPVPAYWDRLFLLLLGLVAVAAAGWAACWSVPGYEWLLSVTAPYSSQRRNTNSFSCLWDKKSGACKLSRTNAFSSLLCVGLFDKVLKKPISVASYDRLLWGVCVAGCGADR